MQIINLKDKNVSIEINGISGNVSNWVSTTENKNWEENTTKIQGQ